MSIDFSRKLIKGKITEVIFEQMIREEGKYTVIPFGYEHTVPTLSQFQHLAVVRQIMNNISDAPDFALISEDKTKVYLVEVKFQNKLNIEKLEEYATKLQDRWEYPWLFVATPERFYNGLCRDIIKEKRIPNLTENWVAKELQDQYLKLLNEFEK